MISTQTTILGAQQLDQNSECFIPFSSNEYVGIFL